MDTVHRLLETTAGEFYLFQITEGSRRGLIVGVVSTEGVYDYKIYLIDMSPDYQVVENRIVEYNPDGEYQDPSDSAHYFKSDGSRIYSIHQSRRTGEPLSYDDLIFRRIIWEGDRYISSNSDCSTVHSNIYDGVVTNFAYPSVTFHERGTLGQIWVSFTYYDSGTERHFVAVKHSEDEGMSWSPLEKLTLGWGNVPFSKLVYFGSYVYCFYTDNDNDRLIYRRKERQASGWESEVELVSASSAINNDFDIEVSSTDLVCVFYRADDGLFYSEYNGTFWVSREITPDVANLNYPRVSFHGDLPVFSWREYLGDEHRELNYLYRVEETTVGEPIIFLYGAFDSVLCYDDGVGYEDKTSAAADSIAADIYHDTSTKLIEAVGDCLYLGKDTKFHTVSVRLSTPGSEGIVVWEYWDGSSWTPFSPYSGAYSFNTYYYEKIIFWLVLGDSPSDWVVTAVDGVTKYWVRVRVTSEYNTAPIGTQITSAVDIDKYEIFYYNLGGKWRGICLYSLYAEKFVYIFIGDLEEAFTQCGFRSSTYFNLTGGTDLTKFYMDTNYVLSSGSALELEDELDMRVSFNGGEKWMGLIYSATGADLSGEVLPIPSTWRGDNLIVDVRVHSYLALLDEYPTSKVSSEYLQGNVGKPGIEVDAFDVQTGEKVFAVISGKDGTFQKLIPPGDYDIRFRGLPQGTEASVIVNGRIVKTQKNIKRVSIGHSDYLGKFGKSSGEISKQIEESNIKDTFAGIEWGRYLIFDTFADPSKVSQGVYEEELEVGEGKLFKGGTSMDWFMIVTDPSV